MPVPSLPFVSSLDSLPHAVAQVVRTLAVTDGAHAVVLGGSRATDTADTSSDWDITVYYRGTLDLRPLAACGEVHPPGSWGRLMNGGAWLVMDGLSVDVMLRDLDVVEHWTAQAQHGVYELDALLGYIAGIPTYVLMAELAAGRCLAGSLPTVRTMPDALMSSATPRWRFARDFSLEYARMHADRGNLAGAMGHAVRAAYEEAHARLCERGVWVLNEKRMLTTAGLDPVQALMHRPHEGTPAFTRWLDELAACLSAPPLGA